MSNIKKDLVPIGEIFKVYGIRGEVKVLLYNPESEILKKDLEVWVNDGSKLINLFIEDFKVHNKFKLIKFQKYDRNDIEVFLNIKKIVYVSRKNFPLLEKENFYLIDLIGFFVFDNGKNIGRVIDVINLPTNNSLLINLNDKEYLLPILDHLNLLFDFEGKKIIANNVDKYIF